MSSLEERLAKLERLVEAQQVIIEAKDAEIARLHARIEVLERRRELIELEQAAVVRRPRGTRQPSIDAIGTTSWRAEGQQGPSARAAAARSGAVDE